MMKVKTIVKPSPVAGLGMFAAAPIARGTITWLLEPAFDRFFKPAQVAALAPLERQWFETYSFVVSSGDHCLCADNDRFINHCHIAPNIDGTGGWKEVALRDIAEGEELLVDYRTFEPGYFQRRGIDMAAWARDAKGAEVSPRPVRVARFG